MNSLIDIKRTILLTGATGFLGSHLLERFIAKGERVIALKRSTSSIHRVAHLLDKAIFYDIDKTTLDEVFTKNQIQKVIHTACCYGRRRENASEILLANLIFPMRVLEASKKSQVRVFLNTGTLLKREVSPYALSKAQFTDWLPSYAEEMRIVDLRMEYMYGPGDSPEKLLPNVLQQLLGNADSIPLTAGDQKRDFIYIDDVVEAILRTLECTESGKGYSRYDIGTGTLKSIKEFLQLARTELENQLGSAVKPQLAFGAIPYRQNEAMEPEMNLEPLFSLGWKPQIVIEEGLRKTVQVFFENCSFSNNTKKPCY